MAADPPHSNPSRREFLTTSALSGAGFMIVPRHVLGQGRTPPSDLVNIATVGINGMGATDTQAVMTQNIVAICDVDDALVDAKLLSWRESVYPSTPAAGARGAGAGAGAGAAGGAGTGRGTGRAGTTPAQSAWRDFGLSQAQLAADAKWQNDSQAVRTKRFVDEQMPRLKRYRDYREMLDKQRDLDAVIVATPDHMHAAIASAAMDAGKHVYVQKPLCWCVQEARYLSRKAADHPKLVTQMGNQGHSQDGARTGQEYLMSGVIGDIREVHAWTNRPLGYWPQGVPRPAAPSGEPGATVKWDNGAVTARLAAAMDGNYPVPPTLAWPLFLGVAPDVPYHPIYHPFNWRGWVDWGQGALGDMGAHLFDHPVWGLKLGLPTSIETVSTPFNGVSYPTATTTYYEFAARQRMPAVKMVWYDGGLLPAKPEEIGNERLNADGGVLYIGSKGKLLQNTYGARPRLLPADLHNRYGRPPEKLVRIPHESHEMNWVNAIKGTEPISCPFSYAAHLVEIMLLGVVSLRAGMKITYDGAAGRVTTRPGANGVDPNSFLSREYQHGFALA